MDKSESIDEVLQSFIPGSDDGKISEHEANDAYQDILPSANMFDILPDL